MCIPQAHETVEKEKHVSAEGSPNSSLPTTTMSGSAVLPPKRPPRTPLKLQLPGPSPHEPAAAEQPSAPPPGRPKLSLNPAPAPNPNGRPVLKLPGLAEGVAGLSLAIPQQGVNRYSKALDRGNLDDDDDDDLDSDDDGEGEGGSADNGLWAAGEQERMAEELLDVINGAPAGELEDELSGRTRRPRSASRLSSRKPSFVGSAGPAADGPDSTNSGREASPAKAGEHLLSPPAGPTASPPAPPNPPLLNFYGDHVRAALQSSSKLHSATPQGSPRLDPNLAPPPPLLAAPRPSFDGSVHAGPGAEPDDPSDDEDRLDEPSPRDDKLDISPQTIKDLGRLGEGASGEVRRVLHLPSQMVMAKKVGSRNALLNTFVPCTDSDPIDHHDVTEPQGSQATSARAPVHARLHSSEHRSVLWRLPGVGECSISAYNQNSSS